MTRKKYYKMIERYNQIVINRQFSPLTHPVDELFPLQKQLRKQIRKMQASLACDEEMQYKKLRKHYMRKNFFTHVDTEEYADLLYDDECLCKLEDKTKRLYDMLHNLDDTCKPITNYEGTYVSNPYCPQLVICLVGIAMLGVIRLIFG